MAKTFGATSITDEVLEGADLRGKRVLSVVDLGSSPPSKPTSFNRNCPGRSGERGKATLVQL